MSLWFDLVTRQRVVYGVVGHPERVFMLQSQLWPLSQDANKRSGICSVCRASRQLHLEDGRVHNHGPRSNSCPGSNKLPLSAAIIIFHVSKQCYSNRSNSKLAAASSMQDTDPPDASQADRDTWRPTGIPLIKHIPKVARPATFLHEVATHADPPTGLLFSTGEVLRCIRLKEGESATT